MFIQRKIAAILSRPKKRKNVHKLQHTIHFEINKESLGEAGLFFWPVQLHPDDGSVRMNICHCFLSLTHSTAWQILLPLFCTIIIIIIIIIISGLHYYECVAPLVANSLQSGRFRARSTASVHDSLRESRSFCTVFIQVIRGRLFQYTEGEEVKICFASYIVVHSGDMPK